MNGQQQEEYRKEGQQGQPAPRKAEDGRFFHVGYDESGVMM
jgi:hypothetical protein